MSLPQWSFTIFFVNNSSNNLVGCFFKIAMDAKANAFSFSSKNSGAAWTLADCNRKKAVSISAFWDVCANAPKVANEHRGYSSLLLTSPGIHEEDWLSAEFVYVVIYLASLYILVQ